MMYLFSPNACSGSIRESTTIWAGPFEIEELLARINALLRRSTRQHVVQVGELEIDRTERSVQLAGKPLVLSPREFELLVYLGVRANQIVPRSRLLLDVWSTQLDSQSNLIDVHISRLRDKLAAYA